MSLKQFPALNSAAISSIQFFQRTAPVDVFGLAIALGVEVYEDNLDNGVSGCLFPDEKNGGTAKYSMVIQESDAPVRKRFTVAHEIAHFLLHRSQAESGKIQDDIFYRSRLNSALEAEANRLAAEILMPAGLLNEALYQTGTPKEAASYLGVSEVALKIRIGMPT